MPVPEPAINGFKAFQDLLSHLAETPDIEMTLIQEKSHKLFFYILSTATPAQDLIPFPSEGPAADQTLAILSPSSKQVKKRYRCLQKALNTSMPTQFEGFWLFWQYRKSSSPQKAYLRTEILRSWVYLDARYINLPHCISKLKSTGLCLLYMIFFTRKRVTFFLLHKAAADGIKPRICSSLVLPDRPLGEL